MQVARNAYVVIALALAFGGAMASENNAALIQEQSKVVESKHATSPQMVASVADATMLKPAPYPPFPPYPPRPPRPPIPPYPAPFPIPGPIPGPTFPSLT